MKCLLLILCFIGLSYSQTQEEAANPRLLSLPEAKLCQNRPKQWRHGRHYYYFSWDQEQYLSVPGEETVHREKVDWLHARNHCRKMCMDTVGIETNDESLMISKFMNKNNITYIWTSGRLCDFTGCHQRQDLKPLNILGWFWSNTNTKMAPTNKRPKNWSHQPWSQTGHTGVPQPDNAEFDINQTAESCMAILNNIYQDGVKWHDVACYHKKPYICEDSDLLLQYIEQTEGIKL